MATFMLVHGACTGGWCWEKVAPLLEASGHRVCAPDLPGLGKDNTPPANVTLADNVEKLSRLLDKMDEPVVLVGHSLGGITISQLAEARRRKIKALVYLCALLPTSGKTGKDMTSLEPDTMFRLSRQVSPDGLTYTFARSKVPAPITGWRSIHTAVTPPPAFSWVGPSNAGGTEITIGPTSAPKEASSSPAPAARPAAPPCRSGPSDWRSPPPARQDSTTACPVRWNSCRISAP